MNTQQAGAFLTLLSDCVHARPPEELPQADWTAILELARAQHVDALVTEQAVLYPEFRTSGAYQSAVQRTIHTVVAQERRTELFLELYRELQREGLHPLVLKGLICRTLYGDKANHRPSSDEDLLIRPQEFPRVKETMERCGYHIVEDPEEGEVAYTAQRLTHIQEVTFLSRDGGLLIEVHINPFGMRNEINRRMNAFFQDAEKRSIALEIRGVEVHTLGYTDHLLFLILHAFKHFLYAGFGIRMVLDILLYIEQFAQRCDWDDLETCLDQVHARRFFEDLLCLGEQYLGFSPERPFSPTCPQRMLEEVLGSGIFGNGGEPGKVAAVLTTSAVGQAMEKRQSGRLRTLWKTAFPGREWLYAAQPEAAKKPWLAVPVYLKRVKKAAGFAAGKKRADAKDGRELAQKRIALLREYGILQGRE